ncbi:hypothetical protein GOBAR_AA09752 [Gossypium barbadense]|uniref:FAR1 domain-containing protein n=1 Tax=Gossypium barbadense TaxID=3634 RepID=A0A2P5Y5Q2_GOSBA|nr:hypothetical protein GOBAR_AA09752 [Gossypium barbadense]
MDVGWEKGDDVNGVNAESNKGGDNNWNLIENLTEIEVVSNQDDDGVAGGKPCLGMEFESEDAGKTFYDGYARLLGFSTHVGQFTRATPDGPIVTWDFACSREVFKRKNVESCNAMFRIERKDGGKWIATKFVEDHNHSMVTPSKVHYLRPRRHLAGATKNVSETLDATADVYVSSDENHACYEATRIKNASSVMPNRLGRAVYNARKQWAPVYFRGTFFGTLSSNQGVSSFFNGAENTITYGTASSKFNNSGNNHEDGCKKTTSPVSKMIPSLWPWQDAVPPHFNLNDVGAPLTDLNQPSMVPVSLHRDTGHPDSTVVLTCFKSMTWVIENKNAMEAGKVAVINLKLHDYGKNPLGETEVQFRLTRVTLEPMLRSMAYISQQLSTPLNRVAVINLKV